MGKVKLVRLAEPYHRYAVSKDGRVWSSYFYGPWATDGKLWHVMIPQLTNKGYLNVALHPEDQDSRMKTNLSVHSLIAETFIGARPEGHQINHKDGDKTHNWVENLEYCSQSQNMKHAFDNGLVRKAGPAPENSRTAKLTVLDVLLIRQSTESNSVLAERFKVTTTTIGDVKRHKTWRYV